MIKKNGSGKYEFDLISTIKIAGFIGGILFIYFTTQEENSTCNVIQDSKIQSLEMKAAQIEQTYEKINRKLDRLIKTTDSVVIVLGRQ
jgi:pyrrolidone-carboxylate peptidase